MLCASFPVRDLGPSIRGFCGHEAGHTWGKSLEVWKRVRLVVLEFRF